MTESTVLGRILRLVSAFEDGLLVLILSVLIGFAATQIVLRNLFDTGLLWADPMLRVAVLWVGMIGAMVATRQDKQISVDAVSRFLPARWQSGTRVLTDVFTAAVAAILAWNAVRLVLFDRQDGSIAFGMVPVWVCELVLPLAFGVIALRYVLYALRHLKAMLSTAEGAA